MSAAAPRDYPLFIGGEAAEPIDGRLRELSEPATGVPLARVSLAGDADVDAAVAAARAALDGPWG